MELPNNEPADKRVPENDISLNELIEMGKRYLLIPLGLLFVEIIYSILTASQDTLAWIQEIVAKIWNYLNQKLYGNDSSTLSEFRDTGHITKVELYNTNFPDIQNNTIDFYVSDECAGVHEMLFITTLIILTPYISKKIKAWSVPIIIILVFCLNLLRLVLIYPLAVSGCDKNPGVWGCDVRWEIFHDFVFEWGSLIILTIIWIIWYLIVNNIIIKKKFYKNYSEE
jgi:exosortase/archaeosortase family protein|tara:strand:- start:121 stop:798 length:678 start_codon:yes stop_codon:yes gene_type:complete